MLDVFYLDDYNTITTKVCESFLSGKFTLYKNRKEIDCEVDNINDKLVITFKNEYNDLDKYIVMHDGDIYEVMPRFITHTSRFEEYYKVDLNSLGSFYTDNYTIFRIWAPLNDEVHLFIKNYCHKMNYLGRGIFEIKVEGNLDGEKYYYEVIRNTERFKISDPFSYSNARNDEYSYVIDLEKIDFNKVSMAKCEKPIIYEISVRDFSSDIRMPFKYKSKFLAFTEEGLSVNNSKIGIDHIIDLGITHLQLLPVLEFDLDGANYNWGYNPISYNSFEWDYVEGDDGYAPIREFKTMVNFLHTKNLRLNLDVVYNHVYNPDTFSLHKILPYYFFRYEEDGDVGNASWCGNETRSEALFFREYLKFINSRLINIYDIDGLRFDLMGILDIDTINYLYASAKELKDDFMFYGEGWKMGNIVSDDKKASIENAYRMPGIMFYSDLFRDTMRGKLYEKNSKGYLFGNISLEDKVIDCMNGSKSIGLNSSQAINYIECHDNVTMYDKLHELGLNIDDIKTISKSLLSVVLFANGIPYINGAQEFLRSKNGINNSYNSGDEINKIDWNYVSYNTDIINYLRKAIELRKQYFNFDDYTSSKFYELLVLSKRNVDIIFNSTYYNYKYESWITYKKVLDINGNIMENVKAFDVPKLSLVIAIKE